MSLHEREVELKTMKEGKKIEEEVKRRKKRKTKIENKNEVKIGKTKV